jgi:Lar family restriction alleviation protein
VNELKPCPFATKRTHDLAVQNVKEWPAIRVTCSCGAEGPYCDTREEAIAAWNTRLTHGGEL